MKSIKVIKKDANSKSNDRDNTVEERNLPLKSKGRDAVETVQNWIAEWRNRTEIETRRALSELSSLKLRN